MSAEADDYDCMTCGACCHSPHAGPGYVTLYEPDVEALLRHSLPILHLRQGDGDFVSKLGVKAEPNGRRACIAFAGIAGGECRCTIYNDRPLVCRAFEVGGVPCREARARFGLGD